MNDKLGYTVSELMEKSKKSRSAVESWISRHGIKPISYEARYPQSTLDELLKSKKGRPAKKPTHEVPKKTRKSK